MKRRATNVFLVVLSILAVMIGAAQAAEEPPLTIVNASSHCDWAWRHSRAWHEQRYAETIHQVLLLMRQHPHYVWQLENENEQLAPFLKIAKDRWPELIGEFWQRVREGRIEVVNAISNPRLTEVYPETLVRNLVLGKEYFRQHAPGITQKVYSTVDLMCGCSQMPQILRQAGYQYFMFSRPMGQQVVFWRKGLDGTRLLCARDFYGYKPIGQYGDVVPGFRPVPVWRIPLGADDALPDPVVAAQSETWDLSRKLLSTVARYFQEVEKYGPTITRREGVLDSLECYTEAGLHGNRNLYTLNNQDEDLLVCLEKAQVMAAGLSAPPSKAFMDGLWHNLLSCTGHAILCCWTEDYAERLAAAQWRRAKIEQALKETLTGVVNAIRFHTDLGAPLVVFNFHSWPVTGPVEFTLDGAPGTTALRDDTGREVAMQSLDGGQRLAFIAQQVPPCGYKTYYLGRPSPTAAPWSPKHGPGEIANEYYRARCLPNGTLEIVAKELGRTVGAPGVSGLGDVVYYEAPQPKGWMLNGPLGERRDCAVAAEQISIVHGPVYSSVSTEGTIGPHRVLRELRLWSGSPRLEYHVEIEAKADCGVFSMRFPVGLSGRVTAAIPFGVEPREEFDREPFRGEKFVQGYPEGYYATRWTDVSGEDFGFTLICPPGVHTGYAFKKAEQAMELILLRVRPPAAGGEFVQVHPSILGAGVHRWRMAFQPHAGAWHESTPWRSAVETHVPLLAISPLSSLRHAMLKRPPVTSTGTRADHASFLAVLPAGVVLSSARLLGNELELRLYETLGRRTEAVVHLPAEVAEARATNFLGESLAQPDQIKIDGRQLRTAIQPWKILTLRVKLR